MADATDATVRVLNVVDPTRLPARERGVTVVTRAVRGEPYAETVDYAAAEAVDVVVMPTRGRRGFERLLLGSTPEAPIRTAPVPVLTGRSPAHDEGGG